MILETLRNLDSTAANGVLAALALSSAPDPGLNESVIVKKYKNEARAVDNEIRERLKLGEGQLKSADQVRFDEFLQRAIVAAVFASGSPEDALARAGQAGRLSPSLYKVEQPPIFIERFYPFGLKKRNIEEAIHQPDDFQHLMNDDAVEKDIISLFMKKQLPSGKEPHWLLVQTHRRGVAQIAQSAWRVYPSDVNLESAERPLDVLKAFVDVFGLPVQVGPKRGKLIECETLRGDTVPTAEVMFSIPQNTDYLATISQVRSTQPDTLNVGMAYCVNINKYAASLRKRGFNI
jgi:hypothetical protein